MRVEWTRVPESDFGKRPQFVDNLLVFGLPLAIFVLFLLIFHARSDVPDELRWLTSFLFATLGLVLAILVVGSERLGVARRTEHYVIDDGGLFGVRDGKLLRASFAEFAGFECFAAVGGEFRRVSVVFYRWGAHCPIEDDELPREFEITIDLPPTVDTRELKSFLREAFERTLGYALPPPHSQTNQQLVAIAATASSGRLMLYLLDDETLEVERQAVRGLQHIPNPFRRDEPITHLHLADGRRVSIPCEATPVIQGFLARDGG